MCFLCAVVMTTAQAQTARIKRISLMTPDLDRSIEFFTEVVGFTLDFEGTLPPGGEPFLGPVLILMCRGRSAVLCCQPKPSRAACF